LNPILTPPIDKPFEIGDEAHKEDMFKIYNETGNEEHE
jgi:hypothetical protein